jgi:hypothetical protein
MTKATTLKFAVLPALLIASLGSNAKAEQDDFYGSYMGSVCVAHNGSEQSRLLYTSGFAEINNSSQTQLMCPLDKHKQRTTACLRATVQVMDNNTTSNVRCRLFSMDATANFTASGWVESTSGASTLTPELYPSESDESLFLYCYVPGKPTGGSNSSIRRITLDDCPVIVV